MAGLLFCLASTRCRDFILPRCNTAPYKRLQRLLSCPCSYTANAVKQRTELYSGVSCDCSHPAANDTRPIQSTITPLAPRWSVSQRRSASSAYQIQAPRRTLYRPAQPQTMPARRGLLLPYADRWQVLHPAHLLRGQRLHLYRSSQKASRYFPRPAACNLAPGQLSGRTGSAWHLPHGGAVQQQGHGGRRGTIDGLRRISFRAFAR